MKNLALLVTSIIFSLFLCEIGLRLFTPFPISEESNKTDDPVLGYRLSTHLDDVDQHGFRNRPKETYDIAALGDSHTYGNNVSSDQTWPSLLGKMTGMEVYNFGVGSYGIYTYHAILKTLVNPAVKGVIIGLYPANDLEIRRFCLINSSAGVFWNNELNIIEPKLLSDEFYNKYCSKNKKKRKIMSLLAKNIYNNSALINATNILVLVKLKNNLQRSKYYYFDDKVVPVNKKSTRTHSVYTDLQNPEVKFMYDIFGKFTDSWASWSREYNTKLGILFIPSKERVVYEYFKRKNKIDTLDTNFTRDVEKQIQFEKSLSELFDTHKIDYKFALTNIVDAFTLSLQAGEEFYPIHDSHPNEKGYQAYARAAYELWEDMNH